MNDINDIYSDAYDLLCKRAYCHKFELYGSDIIAVFKLGNNCHDDEWSFLRAINNCGNVGFVSLLNDVNFIDEWQKIKDVHDKNVTNIIVKRFIVDVMLNYAKDNNIVCHHAHKNHIVVKRGETLESLLIQHDLMNIGEK